MEEVIVGCGSDSRDRLSISGWFHKAQEGEEGYQPELSTQEKSSLERLVSDMVGKAMSLLMNVLVSGSTTVACTISLGRGAAAAFVHANRFPCLISF